MKKIVTYLLATAAVAIMWGCNNEKKEFVEFQAETTAITEITQSSAKTGGKVTSEGNVNIAVRGVCWNTSAKPTTENSKTSDGEGLGEFTSEISGLEPGTTYYVRAYAISGTTVRYGEELSFKTAEELPAVTTTEITEISDISAKTGGKINVATADVTASGVCWGISENPGVDGNKTTDTADGNGVFVSQLTGLQPNTKYYVRAYIIRAGEPTYGQQISFTSNKPVVETSSITEITDVSATLAGVINVDTDDVTETGFFWGTSENPETGVNKAVGTRDGNDFTAGITGLEPKTIYYVKAYAVRGEVTYFGEQLSFETLEEIPYDSGISNITGNIDLPAMSGDGMAECYEDYFSEDSYYWSMILYSEGKMGLPDNEIQLEFSTPINDMNTIPDGRYEIANKIQKGVKNTADPGNRDENDYDWGCWYFFHDGENYTQNAASVGGKGFVEIELLEGSGEEAIYNISFEFYDTNGYKVTGKMEEGYILNFSATEAAAKASPMKHTQKAERFKAKFDAKRNRM